MTDQTPQDTAVQEVVELHAAPGHEEALEQAVVEATELFQSSHGATSFDLQRQVEDPGHYRLLIGWETIEDHLEGFRSSPAFGRWRELVTPHLAEAPSATHFRHVSTGF